MAIMIRVPRQNNDYPVSSSRAEIFSDGKPLDWIESAEVKIDWANNQPVRATLNIFIQEVEIVVGDQGSVERFAQWEGKRYRLVPEEPKPDGG